MLMYGNDVMSAQLLEVVFTLGAGTVLRLERDAWSLAKCLMHATK